MTIITTAEELDALPCRSVVLTHEGEVLQRWQYDQGDMWVSALTGIAPSSDDLIDEIGSGMLTVLYNPDQPASAAPTVEHIAEVICQPCESAHPNDGCADVGCKHNCEAYIGATASTAEPCLSETAANLLGLAKSGGIYDGNQAIIDLVASLPGRPEAEVKAEALDEAAIDFGPGRITGIFTSDWAYTKEWMQRRAAALRGER